MIEWPWLHCGDTARTARTLPRGLFHAVVSIGLSFDGDKEDWIRVQSKALREVLFSCRPGAHMIVRTPPHRAHWFAVAAENCGWEIRDRIAYESSDVSDHWVVARAPLADGTVARNVVSHDAGAINTKDCRLSPAKRWPANFIMGHSAHCSESACSDSCEIEKLGQYAEYFQQLNRSEVCHWVVKLLTKSGHALLDPWMSTGKIGEIAVKRGCLFAGIESNKQIFEETRSYLHDEFEPKRAVRPQSRAHAKPTPKKRRKSVLKSSTQGSVL